MKTVHDYLDLCLVFVDGDKICGVTGDSSSSEMDIFDRTICSKQYSKGAAKIGVDCYARARWTPSSFAWRNNDGVKPAFLGTIEIEWSDGSNSIQKSPYSSYWAIPSAECSIEIVKWRPVVLQSVSPKEDKPMKPVYTAEMHARNELPPIGADCIYVFNDDKRYVGEVAAIDGDACWFKLSEFGYKTFIGKHKFKPIIKTIKVNGFDVPAPMSEAPECGQKFFIAAPHLDLFMTYNYWAGDRYDIKLLNKGLVHTTESAAIAHAKSMLGIDPDA